MSKNRYFPITNVSPIPDVPDGWRLLRLDEETQDEDMYFYNPSGKWCNYVSGFTSLKTPRQFQFWFIRKINQNTDEDNMEKKEDREGVWDRLVKKHPKFATEGANFTPTGLRKFFDAVWDTAQAQTTSPLAKLRIPKLSEVADLFRKK